jgi:aryl-alcohol dehydrogenase-like predicted oxidoreductase
VAAARGITVAQVSLAWLLGRKGVSSILMGATKLHQLEDNLGAADVVLTDEEMRKLNAATAIKPLYPSSDWVEPDRRVARALGLR